MGSSAVGGAPYLASFRAELEVAVRAAARRAWTAALGSPLSPLPMLDALLATGFTEIDVSTKAVTERFERAAAELLREAGAAVPDEPPREP
jgi:hypothetical protein